MNENDKSQSGLQTAVDFAHAARAVKRIMQAVAASGVHGAAAATAREAFPVLLKVLVAALVVFIVMPMVIFTALPNIFFGYNSSGTDTVIQMTQQAMTLGGVYMTLGNFEGAQIDSVVTGIAAEYEKNGTTIDHIVVSSAMTDDDLLWVIAINSAAHQQDLNTMSADLIRDFCKSSLDPHSIYVWNPETERREKKTMYCAIVVPYRVRIVIPASEMWEAGNERPDYVLQNMVGASIDLVIIKVEREAGFAIGSRRLASRSQRYFFAHREDLHRIGSRVKCRMLAVGPRRCLVDCYGHDLDLTQREMRYAAIPDLRDEYHPGMELESVVKVYDPAKDELVVSIKETETNPILGAEQRHPVGSRRLAVISGKYGGGVFCNLPDGVVCMCNYSFQHEDSDFMVGENVMLVVQRYNEEKLQMFGKILSKW